MSNCFEKVNEITLLKVLLLFGTLFSFSCGGDSDSTDEDSIKSIQIVADYDDVPLGGTISFRVFGNDGSNITSSSEIFVGDSKINGSSFSTNSEGTYWAYASYKNLKSSTITINFSANAPTGYTSKVLIEDYTGTWCGWCPRISYAIERVMEGSSNAIVVSIHRAGDDPYIFNQAGIDDLDEKTYPTGKLNRTTTWAYPEQSNTDQIYDLMKNSADIGLALNSSHNSSSMDISVSVSAIKNFSHYYLVVYLVEDKLIHNQRNYTAFYNGADPIVDFEHNNVLRTVLTNINGDYVVPTKNEEYSKTFSLDIPANIVNIENVKIVAFVLDGSGTVMNVQGAKISVEQDYD